MDNVVSNAEIVEFHPNDKTAPAVSVVMIPDGKYRTVLFENCFDTRKEAKDKKKSKSD